MKTAMTAMLLIVMAIFLAEPSQLLAQVPDTVYLSANFLGETGPTFDQVISGDTTNTGERVNPNRVYVLQQTGSVDTPYTYQDPIYLNKSCNLTIIGKLNPITGMPPVIQPGVRQDNSSPANLIIVSVKANITLKYLYILGTRYDSVQETGNVINVNADSSSVTLDHLVIDESRGNLVNYVSSWSKFFMYNCEYRNISNQFWQVGNGMWINYGTPMDTVIFRNNTFFCMGRMSYAGPSSYKYLLYEHNTNFLGTGNLFGSTQLSNVVMKNNIFYGVIAHGADSVYIRAKGANNAKQGFGIIMMDSLGSISNAGTEADRKIDIEYNAYYWPQSMVDFWKSINDTAKGWVLVPPRWMNEQTIHMFNDKTDWPGFYEANNDSVDPGFPQSLVGPAVDSLDKFVKLCGWNTPYGGIGNGGSYRWWQLATNPYPGYIFSQVPSTWKSWSDGYPVPENLKYTANLIGSDGLPLGDLNWFPGVTGVKEVSNNIPSTFSLSQNYPNPFNPTTVINYTVPKSSFISLKVYNILGQEVVTLQSGFQKAGSYKVDFDASKLSSGVYLYRLESNGSSLIKKMILMK